jgi:hypothetical protein
MPTLSDLLWGVLMPNLVGFAAGLLMTFRQSSATRWWRGGAALFAGGAAAAAWWILWQWQGWWAPSLFGRQALLVGLLGFAMAVAMALPKAWGSLLIVLAGPLVLLPLAQRTGLWITVPLAGLTAGLLALLAERSTEGRQPISAQGTVVLWLSIIAPVFVILASAKQGQGTGFIAAALGGVWGASWFTRRTAAGTTAWAVLSVSLLLAIDDRFGDHENHWAMACLGLAPLGLLIGFLPQWQRKPMWGMALRAALVVLIAGAGLAFAWPRQAAPAADAPADTTDYHSIYGG